MKSSRGISKCKKNWYDDTLILLQSHKNWNVSVISKDICGYYYVIINFWNLEHYSWDTKNMNMTKLDCSEDPVWTISLKAAHLSFYFQLIVITIFLLYYNIRFVLHFSIIR